MKTTPGNSPKDISKDAVAEEIAVHYPQITSNEIREIRLYLQILASWNKSINLTGPQDWRTICRKLLPDSIYLAELFEELSLPPEPKVVDIGAGAGIPGIPLRIIWKRGIYTLIESKQKKSSFLLYSISKLGLQNTCVQNTRLEDYHPGDSRADIVPSRAFTRWSDFLKRTPEIVKKNPWQSYSPTPLGIQTTVTVFPATGVSRDKKKYNITQEQSRYFWLFLFNKFAS